MAQGTAEIEVVLEKKSEFYKMGFDAWQSGADIDSNPVPVGANSKRRQEWFAGWLDIDVYCRIGHILRKHGVDKDWFN